MVQLLRNLLWISRGSSVFHVPDVLHPIWYIVKINNNSWTISKAKSNCKKLKFPHNVSAEETKNNCLFNTQKNTNSMKNWDISGFSLNSKSAFLLLLLNRNIREWTFLIRNSNCIRINNCKKVVQYNKNS